MADLPIWQGTVQDEFGNAQGSTQVTVRRESDNALVSLFSDRAGTSGISNPFTTGADGKVVFYTADEVIEITAVSGAGTDVFVDVEVKRFGTAALADLTTSANDGTEGLVPIIREIGGIFGLGGNTQDDTSNQPIDGRTKFFRARAADGGDMPAGVAAMHVLHMDRGGTGQAAMFAIEEGQLNNPVIVARTRGSAGLWGAYVPFWHEGNLNPLEFGGIATSAIVVVGNAASASIARFHLPILLLDVLSSITVANTFDVRLTSGSAITGGSGVTPVLNASLSSNRYAVIDVSGLSGLTIGQAVNLRQVASSSKITVNP